MLLKPIAQNAGRAELGWLVRAGAVAARARAVAVSVVFALFVIVGVGVNTAAAHDELESSFPVSGSTITTQPGSVTLTLSDKILVVGEDSNVLSVQGPDGHYYNQACPTVNDANISVIANLGPPGQYRVDWRVVSADGHPNSSYWTFSYAPVADTESVTGLPERPVCSTAGEPQPQPNPHVTALINEPTLTPIAIATPKPTTTIATDTTLTDTTSTLSIWWIIAGIAAVALVAIGVIRLFRKKKSDHAR